MPARKTKPRQPDIDRWTESERFARALTSVAVGIITTVDNARSGRMTADEAASAIELAKQPLYDHMDDMALAMFERVILPALDPATRTKVAAALAAHGDSLTQ